MVQQNHNSKSQSEILKHSFVKLTIAKSTTETLLYSFFVYLFYTFAYDYK